MSYRRAGGTSQLNIHDRIPVDHVHILPNGLPLRMLPEEYGSLRIPGIPYTDSSASSSIFRRGITVFSGVTI